MPVINIREIENRWIKNNKLMIIADYAHHPIEVEETIKAAKIGWNKRIISVFKPHLFSLWIFYIFWL